MTKPAPDRNKALDMWAAKKPDGSLKHPDIDEIAWACGYSNGHCLTALICRLRSKGADIPKRPTGPKRKKWPRVIQLRAQGLSNSVIAERIGSSPNGVAKMASLHKPTSKAA